MEAITELGTGEALISCLDEKGIPSVVERAFILPPQSRFGTIDDMLRNQIIAGTPIYKKYYKSVDRESAYEILLAKMERKYQEELLETERLEEEKRLKLEAKERERQEKEFERARKRASSKTTAIDRVANSAMNAIGREVGRSLIRGVLGTFKR